MLVAYLIRQLHVGWLCISDKTPFFKIVYILVKWIVELDQWFLHSTFPVDKWIQFEISKPEGYIISIKCIYYIMFSFLFTGSLVWSVFRGPVEALIGLLYGGTMGLLLWLLPHKNHVSIKLAWYSPSPIMTQSIGLTNTHNRHPIAGPWVIGLLLCVHSQDPVSI